MLDYVTSRSGMAVRRVAAWTGSRRPAPDTMVNYGMLGLIRKRTINRPMARRLQNLLNLARLPLSE
jgi:hypothetical protein